MTDQTRWRIPEVHLKNKLIKKGVIMEEDRGELDLTKQIDSLTETIEGYKILVNIQKEQLWKLKQISSENEKNKNLLQGYKKVLEELTDKLIRKDS